MTDTSRALITWKRRLPGLLMTGPAVLVFVAMFVVPMILAFVLSLTDWNGYGLDFGFVGFENYFDAFSSPRALDAAIFTAVLAVVGTVLCNALGLGLAALISGSGAINSVARTVFFYPYIISALVIGFLWSALLAPQGVVNNLVAQVGMDPIPFLTDPTFAKCAVIFTVVWSHFGFNMILYIAGLKSVPAEYYEAATVDGAGRAAQFRNITFPMLAPVVTVNLVLSLVGFLKVYDVVLSLTAGGPAASTQTIVFQILSESFINGKLGFGAAQSVILLVVTAVLGLAVTLSRRGAEKKVAE
ncbi:multiple sugar transport system permease protein/raffinose/stachyose/melibiose transport system permease protein [Agromyces hippuratus]|uniref:Multiple sugar transport system permease protein/raffinose/stachyose/melibiose transport system permease protein n=1 Tax=Agromyces hippuratus TaxID=286438 RepID=A0A852X1K4_9MICO|nr:sugar ABC transporter permease [Agromyces hippuratus]NYG22430.1 multiple sugar transport system permease protein/raffinose/stachyose/melibiose transport system permease protein [Agromyces hippuratus]